MPTQQEKALDCTPDRASGDPGAARYLIPIERRWGGLFVLEALKETSLAPRPSSCPPTSGSMPLNPGLVVLTTVCCEHQKARA
jgi:hypothetical protein